MRMRRSIAVGALLAAAAAVAAGCGNSGTVSGAPTPDPTPTPSLTPTPTPSNTWALSPNPTTTEMCDSNTVGETFTTTVLTITIAGTSFTPNWDLSGLTVPAADSPHGTLIGGVFNAAWAFCEFNNGVYTTRHSWTWQGTMNAGATSFTSTAKESLTMLNGPNLASCSTISGPLADCTSPGLSWILGGVRQ